MWIIDRIKDKDNNYYNQARCYKCEYSFNIDIFKQKNVSMIMEAHSCNSPQDSFYSLF
jgi:hypothetical protein